MEHVYRNSICNIAATAGVDGRVGCLFERNPLRAQACRVRINSMPHTPSPLGLYDILSQNFWNDKISKGPTQSAWMGLTRAISITTTHSLRENTVVLGMPQNGENF